MKRKWLTAIQKKKQAEDDAAAAATSKKKKVTPAQLRAQKGMSCLASPSAYAHTDLGTQTWRSSLSAQQ